MATPDRDRAKELLAQHWRDVVRGEATTTVDPEVRQRIKMLFASERVSFTYCPLTQLLGKLTDHRLDALCLQRGDNSESHWDPRSFATRVVVPWVRDNQDVLGTSPDPYVSNPLRQPRILPNPPNVLPNTLQLWESLHHVLSAKSGTIPPTQPRCFEPCWWSSATSCGASGSTIPSSLASALNRPCPSSAASSRHRKRESTRCR